MAEWKEENLGSLLELIQNGYSGKQDDEKGNYPISRIETLQEDDIDVNRIKYADLSKDEFKKFAYENGDLIFSHINSFEKVGKVALYQGQIKNLVHGVNLLRFRFNNKIIPEYAFYYFNSSICRAELEPLIKRAINQASINQKNLKTIAFPHPDVSEQKRIVSKLDALFDRIDKAIVLLEENIQSVEELMGSVLDEYCSDGDTELKKVCMVNPKKSEVRDLDPELEISFLPMKDLKEKSIHFDPQEEKKLGDVYSGYTYFRDNDVLLAKVTPCFENGKAGIAKDLTNGIGFGSSEYHVLRTKDNILPEWIYYSLFSEEFRQYGVKNMTGSSGLKRVPTKFLKSWKIRVPDLSVQKELVEKFQLIHTKTQKSANELRLKIEGLKSLKKSLLDQAFKGELV